MIPALYLSTGSYHGFVLQLEEHYSRFGRRITATSENIINFYRPKKKLHNSNFTILSFWLSKKNCELNFIFELTTKKKVSAHFLLLLKQNE
jgi:hypothetical protein